MPKRVPRGVPTWVTIQIQTGENLTPIRGSSRPPRLANKSPNSATTSPTLGNGPTRYLGYFVTTGVYTASGSRRLEAC